MLREKLLALPFYLLPHHALSWLMFKLARIRQPVLKNFIIKSYIRLNPVNMREAVEENPFAYEHLNAFFTRALKPECRPLAANERDWICPVDGGVSQAGIIDGDAIFQAKGMHYSLQGLLAGSAQLARPFIDGHFATLYLSPRDYHRIHMPTTGRLKKMIYVPGRLFSVAGFTVNSIPGLFTRNERCICLFDTDDGPMAMILVGAINVSAMETVWRKGIIRAVKGLVTWFDYSDEDIVLERGEEMGRFNLGSTVIVLSSKDMCLDAAIEAGKPVRLGQALARPCGEKES